MSDLKNIQSAAAGALKGLADRNYEDFEYEFNAGLVNNAMGSDAFFVCVNYLKSLIQDYHHPLSEEDVAAKEKILQTENLRSIMFYLEDVMGIELSNEMRSYLYLVAGMYHTMAGADADDHMITTDELYDYKVTMDRCRIFVAETSMRF